MKIDPYKHKEKYENWKEKSKDGIEDISKENSDLIMRYVQDMEHGLNVSLKSVKGGRSFIRLNTIRQKMIFFAKKFEEIYRLDNITDLSEEQAILFFSKMGKGEIKKIDGKSYQSTAYFVKVFKAFWHWYQIINRKHGINIPDITLDLDTRAEKPR